MAVKEQQADKEDYDPKLHDRVEELRKDPDVFFLNQLDHFTRNLTGKNAIVHRLHQDPDAFRAYVERVVRGKIPDNEWAEMDDVRFGAFGIDIILPWALNKKYGLDANGVHFGTTPLKFIRDRNEQDMARTIQHEDTHNLLDNLLNYKYSKFQSRMVEVAYEKYFEYTEKGAPAVITNHQKAILSQRLKPTSVIDNHYDEILSGIPQATGRTIPAKGIYGLQSRRNDAVFGEINYTTFAHKINAELAVIQRLVSSCPDADIKRMLEDSYKANKKVITQIIQTVREAPEIASRLGEEDYFQTMALLYVLKPTQFRHVTKVLEYKHGRDTVKALRTSIQTARSFSFNPDILEAQLGEIKNNGSMVPSVPSIDTRIIDQRMAKIIADGDIPLLHTLDEARKYARSITENRDLFGDSERLEGYADEIIDQAIFNMIADFAEETDYQSLKDLETSLHESEKARFLPQLKLFYSAMVGPDDQQSFGYGSLKELAESLGYEIEEKQEQE